MLVIVLFSKFTHGAWMVIIAIPVLVLMMTSIHRHYEQVDAALSARTVASSCPAGCM